MKKEMISIIWIASDGSELVPTTEVKITLNLKHMLWG